MTHGVLRVLATLAFTAASTTIATAQLHPLDALTAQEIAATTAIVKADVRMQNIRFQLITLAEPPKSAVLAWNKGEPLMRMARVTAVSGDRVLEVDIDLGTKTVVGLTSHSGVEAPLTINESSLGIKAALEDVTLRAALEKRGFTDTDHVDCAPLTMGYFGKSAYEGRRLLKLGCFDVSRSTNNIFGWPIEGLYALVDLRQMKVVEVLDYATMPVAQQDMNFTERDIGKLREPEKPTFISQPNGANFKLDGNEVAWGRWRFHVRFESRQGIVISRARWDDNGNERSVLYQGYMSEMYVPYMDPDQGWYSRTFFDMGEYGIGHLASPLTPGIDCPSTAVFLDAVLNDDNGEPQPRPNVICMYERNSGDPAWRHFEINNDSFEGRPGVELVVRMASQVGNYDYLIDWVFNHAAEIDARVGATGIVAMKGVSSKSMRDITAQGDTRHGTLVAPNLVAVQHDHYFNYRLDLDVDGTANSFQKDVYRRIALPPSSPRRSIYRVFPEIANIEGIVSGRNHAGQHHAGQHGHGDWDGAGPAKLRVINEVRSNAVGNPVGYEIVHSGHGALFHDPNDWPGRRAGFLQGDVWVTAFEARQRFAAGDYVFASKGGQGLPAWVRQNRSIRKQDLVVWVNLGMQHLTRAEDIPVMPTVWHGFKLRPFNFFDRNPAVDLRSQFSK